MVKSLIAVLAAAAAGATSGFASTSDSTCCKPHPQSPASVKAVAPAVQIPPAPVAAPRPAAAVTQTQPTAVPPVPAGYRPTEYANIFVRELPASSGPAVPAVGQILMLPGGTMPDLPAAPSSETGATGRSFVTPEGVTVVIPPLWLQSYFSITRGPDGKPQVECEPIQEPPAKPAKTGASPTKGGGAR